MTLPGRVGPWDFVGPQGHCPILPQPPLPGLSPTASSSAASAEGSPEAPEWEEGEAASHLSDGNFVFHLIQKIMKGGFLGAWVLCFPPTCRQGLWGLRAM